MLHATTNDPLFGQLWGLQNVGPDIDGFSGALAGADAERARRVGPHARLVRDRDRRPRLWLPLRRTRPRRRSRGRTRPIPSNGGDDDGNGIVDDSHGADFVGSSANTPTIDGDPTDDNLIDGGHGVHTAGTIGAAGNNGIGISGVAQDVRIMPLRVCAFSTASTATTDELPVLLADRRDQLRGRARRARGEHVARRHDASTRRCATRSPPTRACCS